MAASAEYLAFVREVLSGLGPFEVKRMFGGAALLKDGAMFGLVDDDELYVKADDTFAAELAALGATPWVYDARKDGARQMGYWKMPSAAFEDEELAVAIARRAAEVAAARKARSRSVKKKRGAA